MLVFLSVVSLGFAGILLPVDLKKFVLKSYDGKHKSLLSGLLGIPVGVGIGCSLFYFLV